ncbi:MAG TPA: cytochrome C oxidase subunit IV family protein [Terriglobia bacterium]|nr:cytochrome C oxidase subunit IV family protein [Terriglobia bacterium]
MSEHIAPKRLYFFVFGSLLVLTLLTWRIAYIDLGPWNTVVALAIAVLKAGLVATFFMHLRWSGSMMRIIVCAAIFWLAIMITLTLGDILTRNVVSPSQGWQAPAAVVQTTAPSIQQH